MTAKTKQELHAALVQWAAATIAKGETHEAESEPGLFAEAGKCH
jgi:hypothetical protein